ncbi:hypothetical protein HK096_004049 [Nowakowskiella sp. JEL0078]|nr:hypothetical protein HK096_004049 [Nowakowskiella sp. JEL0078]
MVDRYWLYLNYFYWIENNADYPVYKRRRISGNQTDCSCMFPISSDEIILDLNFLINSSYFNMGVFEINPFNENLVAFSVDLIGNEKYQLFVWDILKARLIPTVQEMTDTYLSARWFVDSIGEFQRVWIYFNGIDTNLGVPNMIYRQCVLECEGHHLNELIYKENDISLTTELSNSGDVNFLFLKIYGQVTTSYLFLASGGKTFPQPKYLFQKENNIIFEIEHNSGFFYIRTNVDEAINFQILRIPISVVQNAFNLSLSLFKNPHLEIVIPHSSSRYLEKMEMYETHLIVWMFESGVRQIIFVDLSSPFIFHIKKFHNERDPSSKVYSLFPGVSDDIDSRTFHAFTSKCVLYSKSSFAVPSQTFTISLLNFNSTLVSYIEIDRFDSKLYEMEYVTINEIGLPLTMIQRKSVTSKNKHRRKVLMLAYGAYGGNFESKFNEEFLPLLDRGILIAVCHPRGDADLGMKWYYQGKYENKINTFIDVNLCLDYLIQKKSRKGWIAFMGRSAGGLIAGNIINKGALHDGIVKAVVSLVPFVDPIFDLLNEKVPWTAFEWKAQFISETNN